MEKLSLEIANTIKDAIGSAEIGIVLGSGWGSVTKNFENKKIIPYSQLKDMPLCSVLGHSGNFVYGEINGKKIIAMQGRFHLYEGRTAAEVTLPIRIMKNLGIKTLILTNAAGGITFDVGDVMLISDHINLSGTNPLTALKPTLENPVFVDMTNCYDKNLTNACYSALLNSGASVKTGVYLQISGPSYETSAEIQAFKTLGANAVGMSTAIECIFARYLNIKVVGLSLITNKAAGISGDKISHSEVLEVSQNGAQSLSNYLKAVINTINV